MTFFVRKVIFFPVDKRKKEIIVTSPRPPIWISKANITLPKTDKVIDRLGIVVSPVTQTADVDINKASTNLTGSLGLLAAMGKAKRIVPIKITSTNDEKIVNNGEKHFLYLVFDFSTLLGSSISVSNIEILSQHINNAKYQYFIFLIKSVKNMHIHIIGFKIFRYYINIRPRNFAE